MNKNDLTIRLEKEEDYKIVETLVRDSFFNVYRPGCLEHYVLHTIRSNKDFVKELDFVMEKNGEIIGQIIFVKTNLLLDSGKELPIMTMGPICIANHFKRQGYGKILLDYSIEKAKELGCGALCLEGNIDFYSKSGFTYASEYNIRYHGLEEDDDSSFFLCKELQPDYLKNISGEYKTPSGYFVNEFEVEEFDKKFPYKEKLILPTQLFS